MKGRITFALGLSLLAGCSEQASDKATDDQNKSASESSAIQTNVEVSEKSSSKKGADFGVIPLAGTTKPTAGFDRCMNSGEAAEGVTVGIMDCLGDEIELQDGRLNATYKLVMANLDGDAARARLRETQRAWIGKRDESCQSAASEHEGGSLGGIVYSQCILDRTIERSSWLESYS